MTRVETIAAVVTNGDLSDEALFELVAANLPQYRVPVRIVRLAEMPLNPMMEVDRHEVRRACG